MKMLEQLSYRFADIEFDPARNCLRRGDQEQVLRQKSLLVLLYLIEHRERSVTKEELFDNVWDGTAVTNDALVQIIVELRKLLGDDSRNPRFIRTIPKAGYHFISPVQESLPNPTPLPSGAFGVEEITSVQVEITEELHQLDQPADRFAVLPAVNSLTPQKWYLNKRVGLVVLGLSLVVLTVVSLLYLSRSWRSNRVLAEVALPRVPGKRAVAVMYFENESGNRELDWLREGLADMLITKLSRSQKLTLLSRPQLAALLDHIGHQDAANLRLEDGLEIGRRAQAEVMIMGRFARLGEQVRIDVTIHDARTGQLQAAETMIAERPGLILTQIDSLSLKLATHLGASPVEPEAGIAHAGVMTNNLDAYRYYSLALEETQMYQFNEAIALLEKALTLDPQFAMAHARIGYVYAVKMGLGEKARPHLETAWQLSDRLNERDKLFIAAWSAHGNYDLERAVTSYRELVGLYPLETDAWRGLGWALQKLDRNEEALQAIRQGLVTDPDAKDLYNALGAVCTQLGRNDEALAAYQRYIQLAPNDPNAWDSLGLFRQTLGQYEEAAEAYQRALALNPESRIAIIHLGTLYFRQGRYRAAIEQYQRHFQIARDDIQRARSLQSKGWVWLKQGDLTRAGAAISDGVKHDPESLWAAFVLALERGDQAAARRLGEANFAPRTYNYLNERGQLRVWNYLHGYAAMKQGRGDEAINYFRAAVHHKPVEWNYDSFEDCLANAYLELGRFDEAIAEYERILRLNPNYPLAHYHLGQAFERKGDRQGARTANERFLQVWKNADSDVPELVVAKRALEGSSK